MDAVPPKDHAGGLPEAEARYREFWKELVETDGVMDPEKVKLELFDFYTVMATFAEVYCEITGNRLSKLTYFPQTYLDHFNQEIDKAVAEAMDESIWGEDREGKGDG